MLSIAFDVQFLMHSDAI